MPSFRLSTRIILTVILIETVMLSALVFNSVRLISSSHSTLLENSVKEESRLLAASLAPGLASRDRAVIRDVLDLLKNKRELVYVQILDIDGSVLDSLGTAPTPTADADLELVQATQPIDLYGQNLGMLKVGFSTHFVRSISSQTRSQNTLIALSELILSIIAAVLVGLFITRNLRKLEEGARALSRDELDHRIELDSKDEIGDVARSFNQLAEHLSRSRKALKQQNEKLETQGQYLNAMLDGVGAVIMETSADLSECFYISQGAQDLLGYPVEKWKEARFLSTRVHADDATRFQSMVSQQMYAPNDYALEFRLRTAFGSYVWVRASVNLRDDSTDASRCHVLLVDISEQKRSNERVLYLADHDTLTGLYNRCRFQLELETQVARAIGSNKNGALIFIDLDQFKYINDTQGHQAGDQLLQETAQALKDPLRRTDIIGRLGGDEFGIILPGIELAEAQAMADSLLSRIKTRPAHGAERPLQITASMGLVQYPQHGDNAEDLLAKAHIAMYNAKRRGKNMYKLYDETDRVSAGMDSKVQWEERIHWALENDGFVLHYQPIYDLASLQIRHYEVLIRMKKADGGLIYPNEFLGVAERYGSIHDIDFWVLEKSIAVQGASNSSGSPVKLAVNLSGRHFGDPSLLVWIRDCIRKYKADPPCLMFEITETAAMENFTTAVEFAHELHALGCKLALDDFGMGYSSFHYLKNFPVDVLKIDGAFIKTLDKDHFDQLFVKAISELTRGLKIDAIAEFVETQAIVDALLGLNIEMGQGYHLSKPLPALPLPAPVDLSGHRSTN